MDNLPPVIAIVGPTGVGKTETAIKLAQELGGEIVSADSRQVYRYMDVGTAKPTVEERRQVPHHLIDFLDPDQDISLAQFQQITYAALNEIHNRNRLPFLVGGTGQYIKAVLEGWGIPQVPPHIHLRVDLEALSETYGSTALHAWLKAVDLDASNSIDWRNVRRVVRALEVYLLAGKPISVLQQRQSPPYRILQIGLTRPRDDLYERVDHRIDKMIAAGFVDEVRNLLAQGYSWGLPSMSSLGYPEIGAYLRNEISLEEASEQIKRLTRDFIRHQYAWFSPKDATIQWFDLAHAGVDEIRSAILNWVNNNI